MKLGYIKDTGDAQRLEKQLEAVHAAGAERLFLDKLKNPKSFRSQLKLLKQEACPGDTVVVESLPALGRNIQDLLEQVEFFEKSGIRFISVEEGLDTASESGALLSKILHSLLRFDRNMTSFWDASAFAETSR